MDKKQMQDPGEKTEVCGSVRYNLYVKFREAVAPEQKTRAINQLQREISGGQFIGTEAIAKEFDMSVSGNPVLSGEFIISLRQMWVATDGIVVPKMPRPVPKVWELPEGVESVSVFVEQTGGIG